MKRKRINDNGSAGIFEDLSSFLIILIAFAVFISSIFYSSMIYIRSWNENEKYRTCLDMLEALENYDRLLVKGSYTAQSIGGMYSLEKLNEMNTSTMQADIMSKYEYNVSIIDLENSSLSWSFGDEQPSGRIEKLTMFKTIVIKVKENEVHLARLEVTLW